MMDTDPFGQQVEAAFGFLKREYSFTFSRDDLVRAGVVYVRSARMRQGNTLLRVDHEVVERWLGLRISVADVPATEYDLLDIVRLRAPKAVPGRLPASTDREVGRSLRVLAKLLRAYAADILQGEHAVLAHVEPLQAQRTRARARGGCLSLFLLFGCLLMLPTAALRICQ